MYRGFQLDLKKEVLKGTLFARELKRDANHGRVMLEADRTTVQNKLDEYLLSDGSLDGSEIQANWFPL